MTAHSPVPPPAAVFFYSRDRGGEHPEQHLAGYAGLMQADAYAGFTRLYEANRKPGPIVEAACWAHGRRKFFDLARLSKAPIAVAATRVRAPAAQPATRRRTARLAARVARQSLKHNDTGKAIDYLLKRWEAFTRFLDDGRLCLSNNAAERELLRRLRRRRPARRRAQIATAKLNEVDPQAWLADVLARLSDHPAKRIHELLPWNWRRQNVAAEAA
jgi:transposase